MEKILFLGTGGDIFVIGKQNKASGGIILKTEGLQFHIDPGPGSLTMAKELNINPRDTSCLIATGPEIILCNDINCMIEAMTHNGLDKRGVLIANEIIYNGDQNNHPYLTKHHRQCLEKSIAVSYHKKVGINEVEIRTLPCYNTNNIGIKFITSNYTLIYSSKTEYNSNLIEDYKDADILILNVIAPGNNKTEGNLCVDEVITLVNKVKPQLLIITGFGIKMLTADLLSETRRIQKETNVQTIAAKDGLEINPLSFNTKRKQKILKNF
jgi:ribonuclease BN (tRNA processing enzyme)